MKLINKTSINLTLADKTAIIKEISIRNGFHSYTMHDMVVHLSAGIVHILAQTKLQGGQSWTIRKIG